MSTDTFGDLACGSNGGPPRQMIDGWADFRKCRPEPSGLYEVYARFDDEQEYVGRAIDDPLYAQGRVGTRVAGHPVILSVLFDKDGVLRGIRMVSDPRGSPSWSGAWPTCCGLPSSTATSPTAGPAPIFLRRRAKRRSAAASSSSSAARRHCPERNLMVEAHFLRKPGQSEVNPATGETTVGPVRELDALRDHGPELQEAVTGGRAWRQPSRRQLPDPPSLSPTTDVRP